MKRASYVVNEGFYSLVIEFPDESRLYSELLQISDFPEFSEVPEHLAAVACIGCAVKFVSHISHLLKGPGRAGAGLVLIFQLVILGDDLLGFGVELFHVIVGQLGDGAHLEVFQQVVELVGAIIAVPLGNVGCHGLDLVAQGVDVDSFLSLGFCLGLRLRLRLQGRLGLGRATALDRGLLLGLLS